MIGIMLLTYFAFVKSMRGATGTCVFLLKLCSASRLAPSVAAL